MLRLERYEKWEMFFMLRGEMFQEISAMFSMPNPRSVSRPDFLSSWDPPDEGKVMTIGL